MTCGQTEKISLLVDDELGPTARSAIERHLVQCDECHAARENFLNVRRQVLSYNSAIESADVQAALAKVLSRSGSLVATEAAPRRRERFASFFGADHFSIFNSRFGMVAAILAVAFILGAIALFRNQPQNDLANNVSTPGNVGKSAAVTSPQAAATPAATPSADDLAQNFRPKSATPGTRNVRHPRPWENKLKPVREKRGPAPIVRPRDDDGANYAAVIEGPSAPKAKPSNRVDPEILTASHLEQSELLLRAFRNIPTKRGAASEIRYERERAQRLLFRNIVLRREAEKKGDAQVAALLGSLEPILLDIANLSDKPHNEEMTAIKERMERMSLVALLQINSTAIARAYE